MPQAGRGRLLRDVRGILQSGGSGPARRSPGAGKALRGLGQRKLSDLDAKRSRAPSTCSGKIPRSSAIGIALIGHSLGAFLALALGASEGGRVAAIVEYYGALTNTAPSMAANMPPTLILHGSADRTIPVRYAYGARCAAHELQSYPRNENLSGRRTRPRYCNPRRRLANEPRFFAALSRPVGNAAVDTPVNTIDQRKHPGREPTRWRTNH